MKRHAYEVISSELEDLEKASEELKSASLELEGACSRLRILKYRLEADLKASKVEAEG